MNLITVCRLSIIGALLHLSVRCDDTIWTLVGRYPDDFTVTASAEVASFTCRVGANQTLV